MPERKMHPNSLKAWNSNRAYGQLCYLKGLALTLHELEALPKAEMLEITSAVQRAIDLNRNPPVLQPCNPEEF